MDRRQTSSPGSKLPALALGLTLVAALVGSCAGDSADDDDGAIGPQEGYWEGLEIEFIVRDGAMEDLRVLEQPCDDEGCVATCDKHACKAVFHGKVEGTFKVGSSIIIQSEGATLEGFFSDSARASGKLELRGDGGCCLRIGAWAAQWVAPLGSEPTGPTGPGTGTPGPIDWGGHSTGTLHPGPALGGWEQPLDEGLSDNQVKAHQLLNDLRAQLGAAPVGQDLNIAKAA